jgi:hypothetical protein
VFISLCGRRKALVGGEEKEGALSKHPCGWKWRQIFGIRIRDLPMPKGRILVGRLLWLELAACGVVQGCTQCKAVVGSGIISRYMAEPARGG